MTIWRMRIACLIPKATDTQSEYVIITAFPRNQLLYERDSMLQLLSIAVLFTVSFSGSLSCKIQAFGFRSMQFSRVNGCCECSNGL
jgi:hypothetical protein